MASDVVGPPLAAPAPAPAPACDVVAADDDVARFKGGTPHAFLHKDLDGTHIFCVNAVALKKPFVEDGPVVYWALRDVFYKLGYSKKADDLSRFLRSKANRTRLAKHTDFYEISDASHFCPSHKQVSAKDGVASLL